jgi:regulator of sigma E protease
VETIFWFLVVLGPLVFFHELGHFIVAKLARIRVEEFGLGYPPRLVRLAKRGDTEYTLNILPLGGFTRLSGEDDPTAPDSFASKSAPARIATLVAGSGMNFIVAALLLAFLFSWYGVPTPVPTEGVTIESVVAASPAGRAGLQSGDVLIRMDDRPVDDMGEFRTYVQANAGREIGLTVRREGEVLPQPIQVVPRVNPPSNEGALGILIQSPPTVVTRYPLYESVPLGFRYTFQIIGLMGEQFGEMLRGRVKPDFAGPIGIASITSEAAKTGIENVLYLAALLSVNLAILNLLPFPALDGGRLMFVFAEVLRGGRRVDPAKERFVHLVGIAILLSLMVVISFFDLQRVLTGGFGAP